MSGQSSATHSACSTTFFHKNFNPLHPHTHWTIFPILCLLRHQTVFCATLNDVDSDITQSTDHLAHWTNTTLTSRQQILSKWKILGQKYISFHYGLEVNTFSFSFPDNIGKFLKDCFTAGLTDIIVQPEYFVNVASEYYFWIAPHSISLTD